MQAHSRVYRLLCLKAESYMPYECVEGDGRASGINICHTASCGGRC